MQALRKIVSTLIFPTIVYLGVACERTSAPTEPSPSVMALPPISFDVHGGGANTIWVNDDDPNGDENVSRRGTNCNNPDFQHIQEAVTAAAPGDRINVCPGTYVEQVTIPAGKDGIQLRSTERWQAFIKAPAVMDDPKAIVRVSAAQNVTILAFTITGPGGGGCDALRWGIRVDMAGSANIFGNHIVDIRDAPLSGCQNGVAVLVGRAAEATTGSARIIGNLIERYQKNGPTVSGAGSNAEISNNQVLGIGPTALIAQNGIQVSGGATARVRNNLVANKMYTPQTVTSTGILLFQSGKVVTERNTVTSNDVGIDLFQAADGSTTKDNRVRASTFDGIAVDGSNANQVAHNQSDHNGGPGIGLWIGAHNNSVDDNQVENNEDSGILLTIANNNVVNKNKVNDNGTDDGSDMTDGIRINAGTGNTIRDNRLKNNVKHDCHDETDGLLNTWKKNHAETSFPAGLCGKDKKDKSDDASPEAATAFGWDPSNRSYGDSESADYDWVAPTVVDTESLLQLPAAKTSGVRRPSSSPVR